jgi:hypothetical protein
MKFYYSEHLKSQIPLSIEESKLGIGFIHSNAYANKQELSDCEFVVRSNNSENENVSIRDNRSGVWQQCGDTNAERYIF